MRSLRKFFAVASLSLLVFCFTAAVEAAQTVSGHLLPEAAPAKAVGRLDTDKRLQLVVGLPLRNQDALNQLIEELYTPGNRNYRAYLTPAEFTARFGPTEQDYQAVADFFRAEGFQIDSTHPNRTLVEVSGTVGQIEKALHVGMRLYRHPREDREFFAPDVEPELNLVVPVLHISGLDNFVIPHPASLHMQPPSGTNDGPKPLVGSSPLGSYMGNDFRAAYAPNVWLRGTGQYVGLLQFDGYYPTDINTYVGTAGLTNVPLINIYLNSFNGQPGGANVEVALDIEMATSMAPGLAGIIVYEGLSGNTILNRMATDNIAKQLSASWTFGTDASTTQIFQQFATQGQTYFNAAGDSGAYTTSVSSPTDNPYITSVGGTTLSTPRAGGNWQAETTWNWASTGQGSGASSGGVSLTYTIPSWQQGINMTTNHGSTVMRNIPDVVMVSDNVYVVSDNGQPGNVGGDSVASPLWAAFIALANQQAALSGEPTVGFLNPTIYPLARGSTYAALFHDIRTGNNTNSASPANFYACPGYDLCTGWGTPTGKALLNALAPPPPFAIIQAASTALSLETCTPTNGMVDPGEVITVTFGLQNIGGVNTASLVATLLAINGVVPITVSQNYGALIGGGATVTRSFTLIANPPCGTPATIVFGLTDGTNNLGNVTFTMPTGTPVPLFTQNFDSVTAPTLPAGWTTHQSNGGSNWVTSTSVRDTFPNAVFAAEPTNPCITELTSPPIPIGSATAQLAFKNSFNTETDPAANTAYDGGVLEISINGGAFADILAAGGSFASGGYTRTIQALDNALPNGRSCWGGGSAGFISTIVNMPAAAVGQNVQFKWLFSTDSGNAFGGTGWYVDSVVLQDGYSCCNPSTNADLAVTQTVFPTTGLVGQSLAFTLTVTNNGPGPATFVTLTNPIPPNSTFVFASAGSVSNAGNIVWNLGLMASGRTTNLLLLVTPNAEGFVTNTALVSSAMNDPASGNSGTSAIVPVFAPPLIVSGPSNQVAVLGDNVQFQVSASGTAPLAYQWQFFTTNLPGQTATSLQLSHVQLAQAGGYGVVVTNNYGSVSAPASLRILVAPTVNLTGSSFTRSNVTLSFGTVNGQNYSLEYKNNLQDPVWTLTDGPAAGNGGVLTLQDTNVLLAPTRFYRINCN